eukprot:989183_1
MASPKSVETHRQLHFDHERRHGCVVCRFLSNDKSAIKIHIRHHTGVKPFCCLICHKSFAAKGRPSYHILSNHSGQNGRYKCVECSKCFMSKSYLTAHLRFHVKGTPHKCPECAKSFKWKQSLTNHMKIHFGCKIY